MSCALWEAQEPGCWGLPASRAAPRLRTALQQLSSGISVQIGAQHEPKLLSRPQSRPQETHSPLPPASVQEEAVFCTVYKEHHEAQELGSASAR